MVSVDDGHPRQYPGFVRQRRREHASRRTRFGHWRGLVEPRGHTSRTRPRPSHSGRNRQRSRASKTSRYRACSIALDQRSASSYRRRLGDDNRPRWRGADIWRQNPADQTPRVERATGHRIRSGRRARLRDHRRSSAPIRPHPRLPSRRLVSQAASTPRRAQTRRSARPARPQRGLRGRIPCWGPLPTVVDDAARTGERLAGMVRRAEKHHPENPHPVLWRNLTRRSWATCSRRWGRIRHWRPCSSWKR